VTPDQLSELAVRARDGDVRARHELLVALYGVVRKHVAFLIGGGPVAEDAVQEIMIALHRGLPGFRGDANPRTWALTIATRIALRLRRKEARFIPVEKPEELAVFDASPGSAAELAVLGRALATLVPKKRDAFVLMALFELSASEAGKVLGTFANTAASRYRHARAELERYFSANSSDEVAASTPTKVRSHG
jgi:RNA polymerase sigma-70 factor (ECF subfamily)